MNELQPTLFKDPPAANGTGHSSPVSPWDVLTLADAAAYLQVSETVVLQEAAAGRLPGRCLAGQWRFNRAAIVDWLRMPQEKRSSKDRMLALAGIWKDDPTVDAMVEEIYRERKRPTVGGK
jgi:excisionase family DNA binding protein